MRIDLNKITFIDFSEIEIEENFFTSSNRQYTLLFQSSRKLRTSASSSSSGSNKNIISDVSKATEFEIHQSQEQETSTSSNRPEMSKLTFLNIFDNHKPDEIEKLDRLYLDCKGNLPSRRQLSAIAQSIGIQQSKIKKWFEKRKQENYNLSQTENETDTFWDDLNKKLNFIDKEINEIQKKNNE